MLKRRKLHLILWGIPFLVLFGMKTHRTFSLDGDEPHYLLIAESLLHDQDLNLENQYPDAHSYLPQETPGHVIITPTGHLFPIHDIGMGVLLIPILVIVHIVVPRFPLRLVQFFHMGSLYKVTVMLICMQSMAVTGLLSILLFHYFMQNGMSEKTAFTGALACVLTPPIYTHGVLIFTELYSALLIVLLLLLLGKREGWQRHFFSYCLGLFMLSWLHIKNLFLTIMLALQPLMLLKAKQNVHRWMRVAPLVTLCLALIMRSALHWIYLGSFSLLAMRDAKLKAVGLAAIPRCFIYNFFDREYGLLFANPLFWLLPTALFFQWFRDRRWFYVEGALVAAYLANILPTELYVSGWHPAARHILPVVPLLWVPIWSYIGEIIYSSSVARWPIRILLAATIFLSIYLWQEPKLFWMYGDGVNRWMAALPGGLKWQWWLPTILGSRHTMFFCSGAWLFSGLLLNAFFIWASKYYLSPKKN